MYCKMNWLWKLKKQTFKQEKIKDILKQGYELPQQIQRDLEEDRVTELIKDFKEGFHPYAPIYFCIFQKKRYLIDGQHRLKIFEQQYKYHHETIWVCDILVDVFEDMKDVFRIINNQLPLNDLWKRPKEIKEIILEVFHYFKEHYPHTFKHNGRRRPYMNKEVFKTQITYLQDELDIVESQPLIDRILYIHDEYAKMKPDDLPRKGKIPNEKFIKVIEKEKCLYLGMVEEWPRHCINEEVPQQINNNDFQANKLKVWEKYMGNVARGPCFCCKDHEIRVYHFEAGHVIARTLGGDDSMENLRPICSFCNKSMRTENMFEFMKKFEHLNSKT